MTKRAELWRVESEILLGCDEPEFGQGLPLP